MLWNDVDIESTPIWDGSPFRGWSVEQFAYKEMVSVKP